MLHKTVTAKDFYEHNQNEKSACMDKCFAKFVLYSMFQVLTLKISFSVNVWCFWIYLWNYYLSLFRVDMTCNWVLSPLKNSPPKIELLNTYYWTYIEHFKAHYSSYSKKNYLYYDYTFFISLYKKFPDSTGKINSTMIQPFPSK